MTGLPKLPGFTFADPTISKFHVPQTFDYKNGYCIPRLCQVGKGGRELDVNSVKLITSKDPVRYDPSLTYGRVRGPTLPQVIPHFALYDKKCLTFNAFFKQSVVESPEEHYRIRHVNIIYFLEDDTITVMEPPVPNSGFQQGRLVRRTRIPKTEAGDVWHWKDLNVGIDMCIYGVVYHTVNCDGFTKEYMASQGLIMNPPETMPPDPYIQNRELKYATTMRVTPAIDDKLRRFLEYDGKILRFNAVWDNRDAEYGELKDHVILYYLCDDTIAVKQVHTANDGCDPVPLLLKKMKLPKCWTDRPVTYPSIYLDLSDAEVTEYYQPKDFKIGETIFILGRRFLLYDCDTFTRNYFEKVLKITQGPPIEVFEKKQIPIMKVIPPHGELGIGSLEDSLQNCFQCVPKRPKQNEVRSIINANKFLRYSMELDWVHPEDSIRKFLLIYSLGNGFMRIQEPPLRNSGILGGKFLKSSLVTKPGTDTLNPEYYTPADFYIGARIMVHEHRFIITGADLAVYRYMQSNPEKFSQEVVDNMRNYMYNEGFLKDDCKEQFEEDEAARNKEHLDAIGRELEQIKTDREICIESYEAQRQDASKQFAAEQRVTTTTDTPVERHEVLRSGIKPLNKECRYPVHIGDIPSGICKEDDRPIGSETYTVKYPETEEQKLKKYYDDVLRRHEEACSRAAQYKNYHECLPGTALNANDEYEITKNILVSKQARPQPSKDSPCVKKTVTFAEFPDPCNQEKEDICNLKYPRTQCDCTDYTPKPK